jgi:multicomponent Na+:H+ antiporter subunit E
MTTALGVIVLAAVYTLVLGRLTPADLVTALVTASAVRLALGPFLRATTGVAVAVPPPVVRRLAGLPWLALGVALDVTRGALQVMAVVLGRPARPGVVEVPLEPETRAGVVAGTLALTLSPGSVVIDVDERRRRVRLHVIDARDPDAVRAAVRDFYRRYQRPVFP